MPFKSYSQQRFMFLRHPDIAERWAHKYGTVEKPKGYKVKKKRYKNLKK